MGTALDRVTRALAAAGSRQNGNGNWNCPGPGHERGDQRPGLHVVYDGRGVALTCHTGCGTGEILGMLGLSMTDLFDQELPQRQEVARYPYRDEQGAVLFTKVRYDPKGFLVTHPENGQQVRGLGNARRVLYRLPELIEGIRQGKAVLIPEGERDCDRLAALGETATTNFDGAAQPGGRSKWRAEYTPYFAGADVTVIADRDEPGIAHAKMIHEGLKGTARSVKVMQSRTEGKGDDVSDHLDAGFTLDQLVPLEEENAIAARYRRIDWHEAFKEEPEDIRWLKEDFLEAGTLSCLFSKPGVGKSLLSLEIALEVAREGHTVQILDDENRKTDIVDRLRSFGVSADELDRLIIYNFQGLPPLDTEAGGEHLDALAERDKPDLVIMDTVSRMIRGAENDADTFIQLYRCSLTRLKRRGITVLRLDHTGKDTARGQRGSSAKESDADVLWLLTRDGDNQFSLECQKSRSGHIPFGTIIALTREHDPLRHIWDVRIEMAPDRYEAVLRQMDRLGIPPSLGRDQVRRIFRDNGVTAVRNDQLQAAIIERRNRQRRLAPARGNGQGREGECPF